MMKQRKTCSTIFTSSSCHAPIVLLATLPPLDSRRYCSFRGKGAETLNVHRRFVCVTHKQALTPDAEETFVLKVSTVSPAVILPHTD